MPVSPRTRITPPPTILHVIGYDTLTTPTAPTGDTSRYATSSALASLLLSDRYQPQPGQTPATTATTNPAAASQAITIALQPATTTQRLGYTGQTDTTTITENTTGSIHGTTIPIPGGTTYATTATGNIWSYTNNHGDTITTTDNNGNLTWTGYWGPYGENASNNSPPADTAIAGATYGYNGAQGKLTETSGDITLMGARIYESSIGRFTQPDPVQGGCANPYTYGYGDPDNAPDISGRELLGPPSGGGAAPCIGTNHHSGGVLNSVGNFFSGVANDIYGVGNGGAHIIAGLAIVYGTTLPFDAVAAGEALGEDPGAIPQSEAALEASPLGHVLNGARIYGLGFIAQGARNLNEPTKVPCT